MAGWLKTLEAIKDCSLVLSTVKSNPLSMCALTKIVVSKHILWLIETRPIENKVMVMDDSAVLICSGYLYCVLQATTPGFRVKNNQLSRHYSKNIQSDMIVVARIFKT